MAARAFSVGGKRGLMLSAAEENIRTLMGLMGFSEAEANQRLSARVTVSCGAGAEQFVGDIRQLLQRTVEVATPGEACDVELSIGCMPSTDAPVQLMAALSQDALVLQRRTNSDRYADVAAIPGLTRKIAACYAAGYVIGCAIGGQLDQDVPEQFCFKFAALELPTAPLQPIVLHDTVLAGGGGVANGFLWAAEELPITGELVIADPKTVRPGNCNRCLYFRPEDDGAFKAELLAVRFRRPGLTVVPFVGTVHEYCLSRPDQKIRRVLTTVDSRAARRSIQDELPAEILDASTTDTSEVIVHSHRQPNSNACLSCIYAHIPAEDQRENHIAEALGITLADAKKKVIDEELAGKLVAQHPDLHQAELIGMAIDTLFKMKCGGGNLKTPAGKQAAAPFAFISNLAGALLALELVRFESSDALNSLPNYLFASPWKPPHKRLRLTRRKLVDCESCSKQTTADALRALWPNLNWPSQIVTK